MSAEKPIISIEPQKTPKQYEELIKNYREMLIQYKERDEQNTELVKTMLKMLKPVLEMLGPSTAKIARGNVVEQTLAIGNLVTKVMSGNHNINFDNIEANATKANDLLKSLYGLDLMPKAPKQIAQ